MGQIWAPGHGFANACQVSTCALCCSESRPATMLTPAGCAGHHAVEGTENFSTPLTSASIRTHWDRFHTANRSKKTPLARKTPQVAPSHPNPLHSSISKPSAQVLRAMVGRGRALRVERPLLFILLHTHEQSLTCPRNAPTSGLPSRSPLPPPSTQSLQTPCNLYTPVSGHGRCISNCQSALPDALLSFDPIHSGGCVPVAVMYPQCDFTDV